jgi:hypothetical protein
MALHPIQVGIRIEYLSENTLDTLDDIFQHSGLGPAEFRTLISDQFGRDFADIYEEWCNENAEEGVA